LTTPALGWIGDYTSVLPLGPPEFRKTHARNMLVMMEAPERRPWAVTVDEGCPETRLHGVWIKIPGRHAESSSCSFDLSSESTRERGLAVTVFAALGHYPPWWSWRDSFFFTLGLMGIQSGILLALGYIAAFQGFFFFFPQVLCFVFGSIHSYPTAGVRERFPCFDQRSFRRGKS